jgi:hypothetical protein
MQRKLMGTELERWSRFLFQRVMSLKVLMTKTTAIPRRMVPRKTVQVLE